MLTMHNVGFVGTKVREVESCISKTSSSQINKLLKVHKCFKNGFSGTEKN